MHEQHDRRYFKWGLTALTVLFISILLVAVVPQETPMTANNVAKKKSAAIMANQATAVYQYQLRSAGLQTNVWI